MKLVFAVQGTVVGHGAAFSSGAVITCDIPGAVAYELPKGSPVDAGWTVTEIGDGPPEFAPPKALPPTIGPNEFHFLWTIAEQVAIEDIRATDKGVDLFMKRLEDPRTLSVVLAAPPVQAGISRTIDALVANRTITQGDAGRRLQEILSYTWQTK